jgi:glutamate/tyrosine decarboxylase-like PLP-dependent enzyme
MANLTAMFIAQRSHAESRVAADGLWNTSPMTIYASEQIHMSIPKAADLLGFGRQQVRLVACDENLRMDIKSLRSRVTEDLHKGLKPFCVVASAGTVNSGAVDPLKEIADVAREFGLWFHIDGAYGALASMDETKRRLFAGIDRADSISLDPHKWLYVPLDSGCLLFRDESKARAAFSHDDADYIKVHEENPDEAFAFWNYGPELSRRFRALKIWLTLRYYGTRRIAAAIAKDNALAAYMAQQIGQADDFELLAAPQLSICCFRYVPPSLRTAATRDGEHSADSPLDELNNQIMLAVQRGGKAYVSSAIIRGAFALRACITNFRTTRADIDETIEIIRQAAREIAGPAA